MLAICPQVKDPKLIRYFQEISNNIQWKLENQTNTMQKMKYINIQQWLTCTSYLNSIKPRWKYHSGRYLTFNLLLWVNFCVYIIIVITVYLPPYWHTRKWFGQTLTFTVRLKVEGSRVKNGGCRIKCKEWWVLCFSTVCLFFLWTFFFLVNSFSSYQLQI